MWIQKKQESKQQKNADKTQAENQPLKLTPLRRLGFYFTAVFTQNILCSLCSLFSWNPEVVGVHQASSQAKLTPSFHCQRVCVLPIPFIHLGVPALLCMRPKCRTHCGVSAGCVAGVCVTTSSLPCCHQVALQGGTEPCQAQLLLPAPLLLQKHGTGSALFTDARVWPICFGFCPCHLPN